MQFFVRGSLIGAAFVFTYWAGTLEQVEATFRSTGAAYDVLKAATMFTVGYWLRAAISLIGKR